MVGWPVSVRENWKGFLLLLGMLLKEKKMLFLLFSWVLILNIKNFYSIIQFYRWNFNWFFPVLITTKFFKEIDESTNLIISYFIRNVNATWLAEKCDSVLCQDESARVYISISVGICFLLPWAKHQSAWSDLHVSKNLQSLRVVYLHILPFNLIFNIFCLIFLS